RASVYWRIIHSASVAETWASLRTSAQASPTSLKFNPSSLHTMKKRYTLSFLGVCLGMLFVVSCDRELPINMSYSHYQYASLDPNGGSWSPIILNAADQIEIPEPADAGSAEYQAELADLKDAMSGLSSQQRTAIDYWTNNPSIRWMEIAMELVAKYNLI